MIKDKFLNLIRKYSDNENFNSECWSEIENKYSSKSRHYHNLEHLENIFTELNNVESKVKDLDTLLFSIYYHDIIYKPTKSNNEHESALIFEKRISKTSFSNLNECMAQIEAIKDHNFTTDNDTNLLIDLDLSILGKSPKEYKRYSENIRKEYQMYSDFKYHNGRKKFLKKMLDLDSIYKTDFFKQKFESQARKNITNEINRLI